MAAPRRQYRHALRQPDGDWSKFSDHNPFAEEMGNVRVLLRERGGQDGPFRIRVNEGHRFDEWGQNRDLDEAVRRTREILPQLGIGDLLDVDVSPNNLGVVRFKPIRLEAHRDPVSLAWNPRVRHAIRALNNRFPNWENWGICNVRYISGTTTWSQHAYANAIDIRFGSMAAMDKVARFFKNHTGEFDIANCLWRVAGHFDHVHIDFYPQSTGGFC